MRFFQTDFTDIRNDESHRHNENSMDFESGTCLIDSDFLCFLFLQTHPHLCKECMSLYFLGGGVWYMGPF